MKKRVYGSRFGLCTAMSALVLVAFVTVAPVSARENMSACQAGDPGDGSEAVGTGASVVGESGNSAQGADNRSERILVLVPIWLGGILVFQVVVLPARQLTGQ